MYDGSEYTRRECGSMLASVSREREYAQTRRGRNNIKKSIII